MDLLERYLHRYGQQNLFQGPIIELSGEELSWEGDLSMDSFGPWSEGTPSPPRYGLGHQQPPLVQGPTNSDLAPPTLLSMSLASTIILFPSSSPPPTLPPLEDEDKDEVEEIPKREEAKDGPSGLVGSNTEEEEEEEEFL